ncbi:unnamed protein product [Hyaloperonospora brassicae]|uniref:Serine/threonine-protein phosphatase PGAM5, mitochondrial n=1 Tax=Hyaloperonospora brassicae TaxID=162125 RepID=A0AAV0T537_HYABA|nr:unnamed protein product [Hyaloperonospora brassicae]
MKTKKKPTRKQKLSLLAEERSSKCKQRPASATGATDGTSLSVDRLTATRCSNKRSLVHVPLRDRQRDNEDVVVMEGQLVVAEQVDCGQVRPNPPVFRTLGLMHCLLVRKRLGLVLEIVSKDSRSSLELHADALDLVMHEHFDSECKFQLRCRPHGVGESGTERRASSYVFMTSTKTEHVEWLSRIIAHEVGENCTDRDSSRRESVAEMERHERLSQQQPRLPLGQFIYTTSPKTKHLVLVRHGHYINAHVPQASDSQQVLSQMGRQQAELTGKHLKAVHNRDPTRHDVSIYHSDMTRAVETAAIIATDFEEVTLSPSSLLREGWPGKPYSSAFDVSETTAARAYVVMQRTRVDVERMEKAFQWFFVDSSGAQEENNEESYCILVCHANLIRFFLCRALGIDPATTWGHFEVNHCGVTRIDVCADQPIKVIAVNETGHLPQSLITSSEDHL